MCDRASKLGEPPHKMDAHNHNLSVHRAETCEPVQLYVDDDILRYSGVELSMKVAVSTVFDDPSHHLWYPQYPLVYDLLRHGIPFCLPLPLALVLCAAQSEVLSHMTPHLRPGMLRCIDL
jgi:hypothetical protein